MGQLITENSIFESMAWVQPEPANFPLDTAPTRAPACAAARQARSAAAPPPTTRTSTDSVLTGRQLFQGPGAQAEALDLARGGLGEVGDELHPPGGLVV